VGGCLEGGGNAVDGIVVTDGDDAQPEPGSFIYDSLRAEFAVRG
jgi:hypothetical protein